MPLIGILVIFGKLYSVFLEDRLKLWLNEIFAQFEMLSCMKYVMFLQRPLNFKLTFSKMISDLILTFLVHTFNDECQIHILL